MAGFVREVCLLEVPVRAIDAASHYLTNYLLLGHVRMYTLPALGGYSGKAPGLTRSFPVCPARSAPKGLTRTTRDRHG